MNHNLVVVLIWFVVIPDSLEGSAHGDIVGDDNTMSCVHDDCGKSCVIFLRYKNVYHIEETKIVLVTGDCSWSVYHDLCKSFLILLSYKNCIYVFV